MTNIANNLNGVNVDLCERLFIPMFSDHTLITSHSEQIVKLPESQKTLVFRGLDQDGVLAVYHTLHDLLLKTFNVTSLSLISDTNNRLGKDLYETNLDKLIEIKLGSATDGGLGITQLDTIFNQSVSPLFQEAIRRQEWRELYQSGAKEQVKTEFNEALLNGVKHLNTVFIPGMPISLKESFHSLNMLYAGINHLDKIKEYSDALDTVPEIYRFSVNPKKKVWSRDVRPELTSDNQWIFDGAKITAKGRPEIKFSNGIYFIRFTINQKNRYDFKDGITEKVGWGYGLNSLSLNMWVKKVPAPRVSKKLT